RAFATPNRTCFAFFAPVIEQFVAFLPAHHQAHVCCQRSLYPATAGIAAIEDVADAPAPSRAATFEQRLIESPLGGFGLTAGRPPFQVRQGRRPLPADDQQPFPMQPWHQDGRSLVWYGQALTTARQAARFGRAHHTPVRIGLTFGLFPDTPIPDQQRVIVC